MMNHTNSSQDEDGKFFFNLNLGHRNYLFFEHPHHNATYRDCFSGQSCTTSIPLARALLVLITGSVLGLSMLVSCVRNCWRTARSEARTGHYSAMDAPPRYRPPPSLLLRNVMLLELATNLREVSQFQEIVVTIKNTIKTLCYAMLCLIYSYLLKC